MRMRDVKQQKSKVVTFAIKGRFKNYALGSKTFSLMKD